jgi:hypothetical protein
MRTAVSIGQSKLGNSVPLLPVVTNKSGGGECNLHSIVIILIKKYIQIGDK